MHKYTYPMTDRYNLLRIAIISPMGNKLFGFTKAKCFTFITTSSFPFYSLHSHVSLFNGVCTVHVCTPMNKRENRDGVGEKARNNFPESLLLYYWGLNSFSFSIHPSISLIRNIFYIQYICFTRVRAFGSDSWISHIGCRPMRMTLEIALDGGDDGGSGGGTESMKREKSICVRCVYACVRVPCVSHHLWLSRASTNISYLSKWNDSRRVNIMHSLPHRIIYKAVVLFKGSRSTTNDEPNRKYHHHLKSYEQRKKTRVAEKKYDRYLVCSRYYLQSTL